MRRREFIARVAMLSVFIVLLPMFSAAQDDPPPILGEGQTKIIPVAEFAPPTAESITVTAEIVPSRARLTAYPTDAPGRSVEITDGSTVEIDVQGETITVAPSEGVVSWSLLPQGWRESDDRK